FLKSGLNWTRRYVWLLRLCHWGALWRRPLSRSPRIRHRSILKRKEPHPSMNSSTRLQFAALLLIALLFPFSAQANLSAQGQAQPAASRLQRTVFPRPAAQIDAELRDQAGQLSVVIELEDTPSALSFAQAQ